MFMYKKAVCHVRAEFPEDNFQGIRRGRRINMCMKNNHHFQWGRFYPSHFTVLPKNFT